MRRFDLHTYNLALLAAIAFLMFQTMWPWYNRVWMVANILMVALPITHWASNRDNVNWLTLAAVTPPMLVTVYQWAILGFGNFSAPLWHVTDSYVLLICGYFLGRKLAKASLASEAASEAAS